MEIQYYGHSCLCGCGGQIEVRKTHKYAGIPLYLSGHFFKNKKQAESQKKKNAEAHKGNIGWNKGLTKETNESVKRISESKIGHITTEETKEKIRISSKGRKAWNKGIKQTEEIIEKRAQKLRGRKFTKEHIEKIRKGNKGKKRSEESKRKQSKSNKGEKNPNWQDGISFEPYSPEFNKEKKTLILERDNYTCQNPNCEHLSEGLDVHHIDFNKQNNNPENLITLGTSCHSKTNGKNSRQYWTEFYQNIMKGKIDVIQD